MRFRGSTLMFRYLAAPCSYYLIKRSRAYRRMMILHAVLMIYPCDGLILQAAETTLVDFGFLGHFSELPHELLLYCSSAICD
jgi:hypothetical protein